MITLLASREIMKLLKLILALSFVSVCKSEDVKLRFYPRYHLAPPKGWMNDPNGFSVFNNEYHLFYQYNPLSSLEPGYAHWGHAKSSNLLNWEHLPIAMYPDQWYDKNGVFSGSAIVENDTMYLYFTGNLNHPDETPDHEQHQALATSTNGVNFFKYDKNPIIIGENLQPNIRDPKVWKHGDTYYMVLGHSINDTYGEVLLFTSKDRLNWDQVSVVARSNGSLGFMFECPDFFELNGRYVLLFSPQGIKPEGDKYRNLYQTGYIVGSFSYETNQFTPETDFEELDHGHDFYATQTLDDDGRRVMIAWMDMWEQPYPERADGFTGHMTIPRVLSLSRHNKLVQKPVKEIKDARRETIFFGNSISKPLVLQDKTGEISIHAYRKSPLEVIIKSEESIGNYSQIKITYDPKLSTVILDRGGEDGIRRTHWSPRGFVMKWRIFVDASSVELFCGYGEVTFSSRFFPEGNVSVQIQSPSHTSVKVASMRRTVEVPSDD